MQLKIHPAPAITAANRDDTGRALGKRSAGRIQSIGRISIPPMAMPRLFACSWLPACSTSLVLLYHFKVYASHPSGPDTISMNTAMTNSFGIFAGQYVVTRLVTMWSRQTVSVLCQRASFGANRQSAIDCVHAAVYYSRGVKNTTICQPGNRLICPQ